ncbi:MAG: GNAT family N-acetyltransferase [Planctomycetota bacterium]
MNQTSSAIRELSSDDNLGALTDMLHRSYAPLAAAGMRYLASHQDEEKTRSRAFAPGVKTLVGVDKADRVVATITVTTEGDTRQGCEQDPQPEWYLRDDVAIFEQFAVDPDHQGNRLGQKLLMAAADLVAPLGFKELACDTSEHAAHLIAYYSNLGFREVGTVNWGVTNYNSVLLSRSLPWTNCDLEA